MYSIMQYFAPIVTDSVPTSNIPTVVLGMDEFAVVLVLLVSEKLYELSLFDLRKNKVLQTDSWPSGYLQNNDQGMHDAGA